MAYDLLLVDRVKQSLKDLGVHFSEKRMFGGFTIMVDNKMCVGVIKQDLMVRVNPDRQKELLAREGARLMDFTHRPMKGYLMISPEGIDMDEDLLYWVKEALAFNPLAKASKKK